jgi:hypothetical protein
VERISLLDEYICSWFPPQILAEQHSTSTDRHQANTFAQTSSQQLEGSLTMASVEKTEGQTAEHVTSTVSGHVADDTNQALRNESNMTVRQSLRFWFKAIVFSFVISLCVVMEGYDTSLMNKFFAFTPFKNRYGDQTDAEGNKLVSARWQTIILNGTQVCCYLFLNHQSILLTRIRLDAFSVSSSMVTLPSGLDIRRQ